MVSRRLGDGLRLWLWLDSGVTLEKRGQWTRRGGDAPRRYHWTAGDLPMHTTHSGVAGSPGSQRQRPRSIRPPTTIKCTPPQWLTGIFFDPLNWPSLFFFGVIAAVPSNGRFLPFSLWRLDKAGSWLSNSSIKTPFWSAKTRSILDQVQIVMEHNSSSPVEYPRLKLTEKFVDRISEGGRQGDEHLAADTPKRHS